MRVDEGRISWNLAAIIKKPRTEVGRGGENLLRDPVSQLRLGEKKEKGKVGRKYVAEGMSNNKKQKTLFKCGLPINRPFSLAVC